ncbi:MAG: DoxX family protein [Archangium sp.]|nr:DoxX family protein [Archangium sp.]
MSATVAHFEVAESPATPKSVWLGRVLSGLAAAFLLLDLSLKLVHNPMAIETSGALGYPAETVFPIGMIALACWVLYVIPRTALIGAVLWTGYLGGAVATHVRVGNPLFTHMLFPLYIAALLWGGLLLRDARARNLFK